MTSPFSEQRRYDVDWMRTLALMLLIAYHSVISFQPWAAELVYFIENKDTLEWLWIPMEIINIWRIPLLFFISGMGVRFALQRRTVVKLLADRTWRILFPAVVGLFLICPISLLLFQIANHLEPKWIPNPGHLWFLYNIFIYVILLLPLIALFKKYPQNLLVRSMRKLTEKPWTLFFLALPFTLEAHWLQPQYFSLFVYTLHGFLIGFLCFFTGFLLASVGENFWRAVQSIRFITLFTALGLYAVRLFYFELQNTNNALNGLECILWIFAVIGFSAKHLNRDSTLLQRLSPAVYPIYILHLPIQQAIASVLFACPIGAHVKLLLLLLGTYMTCWLLYKFLQRVPVLRPIFGMKYANH
ncbi:MAG: acyltransferase family protein [Coraliomargaritaceae bacterium]